ncbi:MAG: hypothetical protein NHB15_13025 [Methanosarcina barkeri]|nr:hypothetical protein [Methanosarcina sp. ERenArc_MAG2]
MIRANILEHKCLIAILRKGKYREKALYEKNIRKNTAGYVSILIQGNGI